MKKILLVIMFGAGLVLNGIAQETTTESTEAKTEQKPKYTRATFKSTRIINFQSVEMVSKGTLQFLISHHFSNIWNEGAGSDNVAQFFGLNSGVAHTYLSFDYSVKDYANIGLAMAGSSKYEGWAKFKLLRQQTGSRTIPVSVVWLSTAHWDAAKSADEETTGWNKWSFIHQLLIARKFSENFSLQFTPSLIHFNKVPYGFNNSNNVFNLGIAGKLKVTNSGNVTFEYSRQLNMYENLIDKNGNIINYEPNLLSFGYEINTGGHLFQFYISNTNFASNVDQLARNTNKIGKGFALGFTFNRSF